MLVRKSLSQQKNHSHCIRALAGLSPLHHSTNQGARAKQVDPEANRGTWRQTGRSQDRARSNNRSTEPESQRLWAQEPIDTDRGQAKREGRQRLRQHWARRSSERRRNFAKICKQYTEALLWIENLSYHFGLVNLVLWIQRGKVVACVRESSWFLKSVGENKCISRSPSMRLNAPQTAWWRHHIPQFGYISLVSILTGGQCW